jgi:sugar lactone lactonase YvrE
MKKASTWALVGVVAVATCQVMAQFPQRASEFKVNEKFRPKLFKQFGPVVNVPDGMAVDKQGNFYVAAPNLNNQAYPGAIWKYDKRSKQWSVFFVALRHPDTGLGFPMGLEFGEDGNLYYADNQYFTDKNYKSRIIRVNIDKNGEALSADPVVENVKLANAVRCRDNAVYFTDTFFDLEGENLGGIYKVPFKDFANGPVKCLGKKDWKTDKYCIGTTACVPNHRGDIAATDGMCFDKDGNIYTGNFGDGHFYIMKRQKDGSYGKPETLLFDTKLLPCVDGVNYYPKKNWVFIADSERNAVVYWDIDKQKLEMFWINDDTDGADGLLDQPCECIVWDGKLIVSNFDVSFPGLKNQKNDSVHTLSVIKLP